MSYTRQPAFSRDPIAQAVAAGLPREQVMQLRHVHPRACRGFAVDRAIASRDARVRAEHAGVRAETVRSEASRKAAATRKAKARGAELDRLQAQADAERAAAIELEKARLRSERSKRAAATRKANKVEVAV